MRSPYNCLGSHLFFAYPFIAAVMALRAAASRLRVGPRLDDREDGVYDLDRYSQELLGELDLLNRVSPTSIANITSRHWYLEMLLYHETIKHRLYPMGSKQEVTEPGELEV